MQPLKRKDSRFTLQLEELNMEDVGNYMCVVSNAYGQRNWTFTLDVVCTRSALFVSYYYCT